VSLIKRRLEEAYTQHQPLLQYRAKQMLDPVEVPDGDC
jgi:hypothetical protein